MLPEILLVLLTSLNWYSKTTTLPKLYYRLQNRREVGLHVFRKLEKSGIKVTKLTLDLKYFENCVELGICPQYLRFKPPKLSAYHNTTNVFRQVVNNQINIVKRDLRKAKDHYSSQLKLVKSSISLLEKMALCSLLRKRYEEFAVSVLKTHNKKLLALWKVSRVKSPECLLNLSKVKLSLLDENVLRLGLKSHILPKKLDQNDFKVKIEKLVSNITRMFNVVLSSEFKEKVRSLCRSFIAQANGVCSNKQNQAFHRTIQALSKNEDIKICRYDKGNGVVVLDKGDYFKKLDKIILDKEKFEEIPCDINEVHPIIRNEATIKRYLHTHVKKCVEDSVYTGITPCGSQAGKLYGLCKVHKSGHPMRPVISMVGTAEYKLAKFLDTFIKPNINVDYTVDSTSAFVDKLQEFQLQNGDYSVSFDVSSLYTNVPLEETIHLIAEKVYSSGSKKVPPFKKKEFIKLMKFATGGMFLYNDRLFKQVDGVAMGSPLGPSLANFFLGYLEETRFFNDSSIKPKLYVRYVDDIFAVFDKSTNTDVLLNFSAMCPVAWKRGIILRSLNRAKLICSSPKLFKEEVNNLRWMFQKNGYKRTFFDKVLSSFEKKT